MPQKPFHLDPVADQPAEPGEDAAQEAVHTSAAIREVPVPAVIRAVAVLRLLSTAPTPLGFNQIARALGLIPSTCLHILRALSQEGLLAADPATKRYRLGNGILTLAKAVLKDGIADQAQPYLNSLVAKYPVTALAVSMSEPDHYVIVAKSNSSRSFRLQVDLGSRFPALISATGRCVGAYTTMPSDVMRARFETLRWHRAPSYKQWIAEVVAVLDRGYAVDDGNYINGVYIVSSPILDEHDNLLHAIVAICIRAGWSDAKLERLCGAVRAAAQEITERLRLTASR